MRITNEEIIKNGEDDVVYQLWIKNQGIIRSEATKWSRATGTEFDDLMQSSYLAVDEAFKSYTPEKGKFTTLLDYCIKRHFGDCCASHSGWTKSQWERARENEIKTVSLYKKIGEEDDAELIDIIEDKDYTEIEDLIDRIEQEDLKCLLDDMINELKPTERAVIRLYYYKDLSHPKISVILNLTPSQVQQIRKNALRNLRRMGRKTRLKDYIYHVDAAKDYYYHVGLDRFNNTGISAVEQIVLDREALRERCKEAVYEKWLQDRIIRDES